MFIISDIEQLQYFTAYNTVVCKTSQINVINDDLVAKLFRTPF